MANRDLRDVPDPDRHPVRLGQYDVFDVADPVAFCQILCTAAVQKADAADIHRLLTEIDGAAAHIDVGIANRGDHLGQGDIVGIELVQIDFDLELFGGAAPGVDLHDAFDGEQPALHHPILDGAKVGQPEMRGAFDLIAIDFADQARSLDRRHDIVWQVYVLLQTDRGLIEGEVVVDSISERYANERQAVKGGRTDDIDAGCRREADFHGDRVVALHFLGRETGRLRGDFQDDRRRIGVRLDV